MPSRLFLHCLLPAALTLGLAACSDDPRSARVELDASSGVDDTGRDGDAGTERVFQPPATPSSFAIQLTSGPCETRCPTFRLAIDEKGQVDYLGGGCAARPGVFRKQVPAASALALYRELAASPYWTLDDGYTRGRPNCSMPSSAQRVDQWYVRVEDTEKSLERGHACENQPALQAIDAFEPKLRGTGAVDAWIHGPGSTCAETESDSLLLAASYRVQRDGQTIGMLRLDGAPVRWELVDCGGGRISQGLLTIEPTRWTLIESRERKISLDGGVELGSIVIERGPDAGVRARGLREDDDVPLTLVPGSGC